MGTGYQQQRAATALVGCAVLALGGVVGAVLARSDAHAGGLPRVRDVVVDSPEQFAPDRTFEIRFRGRVGEQALSGDAIRVRTADGIDARGSFVLGRPLVDTDAPRQVVIRPEAVRDYLRDQHSRPLRSAHRAAERLIRTVERSGNLRALERMQRKLAKHSPDAPVRIIRLDDPRAGAFIPRKGEWGILRRLIVGYPDEGATHYLDQDHQSFLRLLENPEGERYRRPIDPLTGGSAPTSVLRRREHRRVLVVRRKKVVTFVPDLPTDPNLTTLAFIPGRSYEVQVGGSEKVRALLQILPATAEPLFGDPGQPAADPAELAPRVFFVTPPDGEPVVDPTSDWEDVDDLSVTPEGDRPPFRIRLQFTRPLDPRTVIVGPVRLTREADWDEGCIIGLPSSGGCPVPDPPSLPIDVRLHQSRLGKVELEITPLFTLEPLITYRVHVGPEVTGLDGTPLSGTFFSTFTTAPPPRDAPGVRVLEDDFAGTTPDDDRLLPWLAPPAEDPEGLGLLVGRTDGPDGRTSRFVSGWYELHETPAAVFLLEDDPETPEVEGVRVLERPGGGTVRISLQTGTSWFVGSHSAVVTERWVERGWALSPREGTRVQFRIEFTLPEDYVPGTPRTAVDRIVFRANYR